MSLHDWLIWDTIFFLLLIIIGISCNSKWLYEQKHTPNKKIFSIFWSFESLKCEKWKQTLNSYSTWKIKEKTISLKMSFKNKWTVVQCWLVVDVWEERMWLEKNYHWKSLLWCREWFLPNTWTLMTLFIWPCFILFDILIHQLWILSLNVTRIN